MSVSGARFRSSIVGGLSPAGAGGKKQAKAATTQAASGLVPAALDASKAYTVTLKTNQGTFACDLDVRLTAHDPSRPRQEGFFDA